MSKIVRSAARQFNLNTLLLGVAGWLAIHAVNRVDTQIEDVRDQHMRMLTRLTRIETALKLLHPALKDELGDANKQPNI